MKIGEFLVTKINPHQEYMEFRVYNTGNPVTAKVYMAKDSDILIEEEISIDSLRDMRSLISRFLVEIGQRVARD